MPHHQTRPHEQIVHNIAARDGDDDGGLGKLYLERVTSPPVGQPWVEVEVPVADAHAAKPADDARPRPRKAHNVLTFRRVSDNIVDVNHQ